VLASWLAKAAELYMVAVNALAVKCRFF